MFPRIGLTVLIASILLVVKPVFATEGQEWANDLIANVRANENLFKSMEAIEEWEYVLDRESDHTLTKALRNSHMNVRTVRQGPLFYYKRSQDGVNLKDEARGGSYVTGFDGETTRRVTDEKFAHIYPKKKPASQGGFYPHQWLLYSPFPLSLWIKGGKDLQTDPRAYAFRKAHIVLKDEGREKLVGLECIKFTHEHWERREEARKDTEYLLQRTVVWLAPERNYLPIKIVAYLPNYSNTIPLSMVTAEDFRELSPGIWLPYKRVLKVNDEAAAKEKKVEILSNSEVTKLTLAKLDPNYDISLFRDIPIPEGAKVYEVVNGKIVSSYNNGEHITHPVKTTWNTAWILGGMAVILSSAGILYYYLRRRRRISGSTT